MSFELEISLLHGTLTYQAWYNFQKYARAEGDDSFWSEFTLKNEYGATLCSYREVGRLFIQFPKEEYKTWFILRFS